MSGHLRHRGVVMLDEEFLVRALRLPDGQRILGFRGNIVRMAIEVLVEGPGLPYVAPGMDPPYVAHLTAEDVPATVIVVDTSGAPWHKGDPEPRRELAEADLTTRTDPDGDAAGSIAAL